ncbi:hypothetical protein HBI72_243840 [Parastagonospora nodorum]|nr:hypothetical protein HBI72_243840 [Parastagonospora nodorum]
MDRFCTICGFQPKTYAGLAKHTARYRKVHVCAADGLSSTVTVYDYIEKDKNADLAIADGISDAPDMCAKDDLTHDGRLAGELATAESVTAKDPNYVDTFGLDFAFSFAAWLQRIKCTLGDVDSLFADARLHDLHTRLLFQSGYDIWIQEDIAKTSGLSGLEADQHFFVYQNILLLIAFIISYRPFADELWWNIQQSLPDGATVVLIIILVDKTQLLLISGDVAAWLVYVTIGNLSCEARRRRSTPGTLLARFIPTTKIRDLFLKTLENAAKSGILLACADGRIRQCYLTICAILADYEEQVLLTGVKKNRYCTRCTVAPDDREDLCGSYLWRTEQFTRLQQERCLDKGHDDFVHLVNCFGWKHYNFNIYVSLATDTLHLLLKGLLNERFRQVMHSTGLKRFNNKRAFTEAIIQQLIAVVSPLFISKAPFALHFIRAVCDLVTLAQYKSHNEDTLAYIQGALERMNIFKEEFRHALTHIIQDIRMYGALDSICTGANSEVHHITIVKQFYSMTNKKEYILQICLHNSRRTALLAADYATVPHLTKLPLSEVAANIAISDFIYAAAVFDRLDVDLSWVGCMSVQIHPSIKCWRSSGKRHNDSEYCDEEVVRCAPNWQQTGLWRRDYVWVQEFEHRDNRRQSRTVTDDGKHMAYIRAFSEVLLFNNNGQIDNTTGMLTFKFYDLSTIIRPVHLVPRDLPNSTTCTTMSYYVNNYID